MKMEYFVERNNSEFVIRERKTNYAVDLSERLLNFSIKTIKFIMTLPDKKEQRGIFCDNRWI
jgi:hypothetical protein